MRNYFKRQDTDTWLVACATAVAAAAAITVVVGLAIEVRAQPQESSPVIGATPAEPRPTFRALPIFRIIQGDAGDYAECWPASSTRCSEFLDNCINDACGAGSVDGGGVSCSCTDE